MCVAVYNCDTICNVTDKGFVKETKKFLQRCYEQGSQKRVTKG